MRHLLHFTIICVLFCNTVNIYSQSDTDLSKNLATGIAELRTDIFERKQAYNKKLNDIVVRLDSSSIKEPLKKEIHEFIRGDIANGALSNSLANYDLIPEANPFKNIYIEQYIANNQDFQIDKDLILELAKDKVIKADGKINGAKLEELQKDFEFLDINKNDRILLYDAWGARYAILLGYTYEGIDLTIHNQYRNNHYLALDRMDRYPNINNGNVIEFLHAEDARIIAKGEQWNKIIIRDTTFLERPVGYILKSFHDNLTGDGHLYIHHDVASNKEGCENNINESKIIKSLLKANFKLIAKLEAGCQTYFKFQSTKE